MRGLLLSSLLVSSVLAALPCPSGKVAVPSPASGYLECTNATRAEVCGISGSCEIVDNPLAAKSQEICCVAASLLCPDGQYMYGGRCFEEIDLPSSGSIPSSCVVDADCGSSARCLNSTCTRTQQLMQQQFGGSCNLGQVSVNGQCLALAAPGSTCQASQQCIDSSTCTNQRCVCSTFNAQIINGYCIVPSPSCPQTQTQVNGVCMTYATAGNQCQGNGHCVGGATCLNNVCTCPSNLSPMTGYCVPNPTQSSGQCSPSQVLVNGQCLPIAAPGGQCTSPLQCIDRSTCTNSACTCTTSGAKVISGYCLVPVFGCSETQTKVNSQCMSYAIPGAPCQASEQCVGGSTCLNSMCSCPQGTTSQTGYCVTTQGNTGNCPLGQVSVNGQCLASVQLGGFCQAVQQCPSNAVCQGTCQCQQGFSSQNGQCVGGSTGGCQQGQVLVNGQCLPIAAPGGQCTSPLQCIDRSTCTNSACTCTTSGAKVISGYCLVPVFGCSETQTKVNNQCLSYAIPGAPCQANEQCVGGSTCLNSMCSCLQGTTSQTGYCVTTQGNTGNCPLGQVSVNGQCLASVQLGGFCQAVQQCPSNAVCQGTCQCQQGFSNQNGQCVGGSTGGCQLGQVFVNGQCVSLAAPGSQCQSSLQCIDSSSCINQRCACTNSAAQIVSGYCLTPAFGCGQTQTKVNGQCVTFAQPGSPCQANEQCVAGSTCSNQVCTCPSGTTEMNKYCIGSSTTTPSNPCQTGQVQVNGQCISLAAPGSTCQATAQCLDSSTCNNNFCVCSNMGSVLVSGYCVTPVNGCSNTQTLVNGQCVSLATPGQACQANQQCVAGAACTNQVCTCPAGRTLMNGYCVPTGGGGSGGCTNGQVLVNGVCVPRSPIGGQCQQAAQCGDKTQCSNGICQCALGYQQVLGNCVRSGDSSCQRGQVSVNGQCVSLVSPGFQCISSLQCIDNSNCLNGMCSCAATNMQALSGYCVQPGTAVGCGQTQARVNGMCVTFSIVGQSCVGSEQCVGGSVCNNQQCACPMGRYSMNGYCLVDPATSNNCNAATQVLVNGVCYNLVQQGQQCQFSQQCIGGGQCFNSICQGGLNCPTGQVAVNGQCMYVVQPGGFCQVSQQCANNGQCLNGICQAGNTSGQCKTYQVSVSGQCYDTVSIGQQCTVQQQCINNANCLANRCQCNTGFTFNGQNCISGGFPTCNGLTVSTNGQCLMLVAMNQFCTATLQCMGFSVCTSSLCQCPYAYSEVNGVCRKSTSVNNCPSGQVMSPSGACLAMVGVGGACQINEQCPTGGSCSLGRCTQGSSGGLTCNDPNKEVAIANGQPINCQVQLCPADAQCEMAQQQFVCCRPRNTGGISGYCPAGQTVELLPSGTPKNCMIQACSTGRVCMNSANGSGVVCCGSSGIGK